MNQNCASYSFSFVVVVDKNLPIEIYSAFSMITTYLIDVTIETIQHYHGVIYESPTLRTSFNQLHDFFIYNIYPRIDRQFIGLVSGFYFIMIIGSLVFNYYMKAKRNRELDETMQHIANRLRDVAEECSNMAVYEESNEFSESEDECDDPNDPTYEDPTHDSESDSEEEEEEKRRARRRGPSTAKKPRPLSGYLLFCKTARHYIIKTNPCLSFEDTGKMLGKMWRELSANEKLYYKMRSKMIAS